MNNRRLHELIVLFTVMLSLVSNRRQLTFGVQEVLGLGSSMHRIPFCARSLMKAPTTVKLQIMDKKSNKRRTYPLELSTRLPITFTTSTCLLQSRSVSNKSYKLKGDGEQTSVSIQTNTNHTLQTDIPLAMGGKDSGAQPVEHLLSAFIGCTQATALFVGRNMKPDRILIDRMEFDIEGERDERGALDALPIDVLSPLPSTPARLVLVKGVIRVFGVDAKSMNARRRQQAKGNRKRGSGNGEGKDDTSEEQVIAPLVPAPITQEQMALLERQTEARCPVADMMIASGCKIDIQWLDGNK
uniref:OsmC-like protein n=1 Tax=Chaetoceros debilis TaxID=122233 RepID=A0A7S3PY91_9STRA|mmetsp:Transcript_23669/g.35984  ORF Transcript_23669/g.35984 Transcript_23669/m.35984 type:complete len:299 (+) Transcript_23669:88-984(+)